MYTQIRYFSALLCLCFVPAIFSAQTLQRYILEPDSNQFIEVAKVFHQLTTPVDLAFHPDQQNRPNELWILNQGYYNSGGHTVIASNATGSNTTHQSIKDGNAWHFMALASAMAFGDNGNWATSQDILDANRSGYNFTGPTLWSSDLSVYGQIGNPPNANYNGSHLDMVHQTPYGKGIAHEKDNIYWVFDGYSNTVTRYNFNTDHGPGQDYHGDAEVHVFEDVTVFRDPNLPSHMVMDKQNGWLYIVHTSGKEILRLDVNTGSRSQTLPKISNEPLADYASFTGATVETIVDQGLQKPVGIHIHNDILLVSDNATGEIILYDMQNDFAELGRIALPYTSPDIMGITVGPDNSIYFVDYSGKKAYRIQNNTFAVGIDEAQLVSARLMPNPANHGHTTLQLGHSIANTTMAVYDATGRLITTEAIAQQTQVPINVSEESKGLYLVTITNGQGKVLWERKLLVP